MELKHIPLPEYKDISVDSIKEAFESFFTVENNIKQKHVKLYTGVGGADMFDEEVERQLGYYRVIIGIKVPRFLRVLKAPIKKSKKDIYYKLLKL